MTTAENKTQKAVRLHKEGKVKEALRIFKTFRNNVTKEEKRTLEIAYEALCGRSSFYKTLGIDTDKVVANAIALINAKYA